MKSGKLQAKDIPDDAILAVIDRIRTTEGRWTHRWDLDPALPDYPSKVILAKCASLIKRGVITGCTCGCRGDFERATDAAPSKAPRR